MVAGRTVIKGSTANVSMYVRRNNSSAIRRRKRRRDQYLPSGKTWIWEVWRWPDFIWFEAAQAAKRTALRRAPTGGGETKRLREQTEKANSWNTPSPLWRFCPLSLEQTMGKQVICSSQIPVPLPPCPLGFCCSSLLSSEHNRSSPRRTLEEGLLGFSLHSSIDGFSSSPSAVHLLPAPLSSNQVISQHSESAAVYPNCQCECAWNMPVSPRMVAAVCGSVVEIRSQNCLFVHSGTRNAALSCLHGPE